MAMLAILFLAVTQVQLPTTPVGRKLDSWLQAVNSGDRAKIRAVHAGEKDAARYTAGDAMMGWETGGFDVHAIEQASDDEISVLVHTRLTEMWLHLKMRVDAGGSHEIRGIGLRPADAPADNLERGQLDDAEIARRLDTFIDKLVNVGRFSGAVLLVHNGKTVFERAVGLASRAWNAPNRVDTKFNLGSMNKMFTAVAIGQLLERGKLKLDDKVGRYLPDFPNVDVREKVTIRQLLSHTSGMGSMFGPKFEEKKLSIREVRDYLPVIAEEKLQFEPGSKWAYSNSGFVLLGAIVEKASGENYFEYIRKHVYAVAGMKDTDCYDVDRDVPNMAVGYTRDEDDGTWWSNVFLHVVRGGPAGGGYSTVQDLVRFANALRNDKLLKPATTREFTTGKSETPGGGHYAFGFGDDNVRGHRIVGHSGGFPGISSNLDILWNDGWMIAVMANVDMGAAPIQMKARELIIREPK